MENNIYLMIFVMAGVTYLIRMLPLALGEKRDYQSVYTFFFVLCAVCLSRCHDVSGDFIGYF